LNTLSTIHNIKPKYGVPTTNPEVMGRLSHAVGNHTKHEGKKNKPKRKKTKK
jgi:hypothetical protein